MTQAKKTLLLYIEGQISIIKILTFDLDGQSICADEDLMVSVEDGVEPLPDTLRLELDIFLAISTNLLS